MIESTALVFTRGKTGANTKAAGTTANSTAKASTDKLTVRIGVAAGKKANVLNGLTSQLWKELIQVKVILDNFLETDSFSEEIITPGRRRLLENSKKNNIDWDFNQDLEYDVDIPKGKNVYHQKFGNGKIIKLDGDKALIDFENFSSKKVYLKFLKIID